MAVEVNPDVFIGVVVFWEVIVSISSTGEIPLCAIDVESIDAAEGVGALVVCGVWAILNEEVLALFITKTSDSEIWEVWIPDVRSVLIRIEVLNPIKANDEVITGLIALFTGLGSDEFTGVRIDVRDLAV